MLDADSLLVQRFGNKRPGLDLIAIEDAALPVTVVRVEVLAQERKGLPLLDEFVLRLAEAGLSSADDIASFLGLDTPLVESNVADQVVANNLIHGGSQRHTLALTAQGKRTVQELESVQPVQKQMPVVFDRLTWHPASYPQNELITKQDAQQADMVLLPTARSSRISQDDMTAVMLNSLLAQGSSESQRFEVLAVRRVHPNTHRYLPVKLLVYGDVERGETQLAVSVDGDISEPHELAIDRLGGADALRIRVDAPGDRPLLPDDLEAIRVPSTEIVQLRSATISGRIEASRDDAVSLVRQEPTSNAERALAKIPVRSVSVFEHKELLNEALDSAQARILLISPWVKSAVVNNYFLSRLERRLGRGVRVHIAHGIGRDDNGSDERALRRLDDLSQRYPDRFILVRLANSHAKILIFDGKWITTSFNWLSFRGDPDRTYRMEEGTLVQIPEQVNLAYDRYVHMIDEQRAAH